MPKIIYTERDIDDLARRGVKEIAMTDEIYLTDVARERAEKVGIALRVSPTPAARPDALPVVPHENTETVVSQVKADVVAKLGPGIDAAVIERIVRRVVDQLEVRR